MLSVNFVNVLKEASARCIFYSCLGQGHPGQDLHLRAYLRACPDHPPGQLQAPQLPPDNQPSSFPQDPAREGLPYPGAVYRPGAEPYSLLPAGLLLGFLLAFLQAPLLASLLATLLAGEDSPTKVEHQEEWLLAFLSHPCGRF